MDKDRGSMPFDVEYGIASAYLTVGTTVVATTAANYHGITVIAGSTTTARVVIYDNASTASGNRVDMFLVGADSNKWIDRYIPVKASKGLVVSITGTGAEGTVFYGPKG